LKQNFTRLLLIHKHVKLRKSISLSVTMTLPYLTLPPRWAAGYITAKFHSSTSIGG